MARFPLVPTAPEPERAVLVGVEWRDNAWPLDRSLDELERLAHTAGAQCVARLSQRLVKPYPKSFIGSGKVEELCGLVKIPCGSDADHSKPAVSQKGFLSGQHSAGYQTVLYHQKTRVLRNI